MQLRRNRRKRADKMSGWKCPRVRDVDVIPTADADDDVTTPLVTAVTGTHPPVPELQELLPAAAEPAVVGDANHDICTICNQVDPPSRKRRRVVNVQWVGCDHCPLWFHHVCVWALVPKPQYSRSRVTSAYRENCK